MIKRLIIVLIVAAGVGACTHKKEGWIVMGQDGNYYRLNSLAPNESYSLEPIDTTTINFIKHGK